MKKTRYVLLGLLQEEELSGYEMKKIIDIRMSFFWQESFGQIYPELRKMTEEGLIEFSNNESNGKIKREKIRYKVTPEGEKEIRQWMEADNEKDTSRSEFLLKMFLSNEKNVEEMRKHIIRFKEQSEQKLELFNLFDVQLNRDIEIHNNHKHILYVLNLGIRQAKLYIDWSKEILEHLEKGE
ncbi:PadR family transcriptional regulator [Clostridium sp. CM027]|uniref:PadR family transcriptional regulator n=1 Tax=Clostridium sp. CM027 TaxID=2849865 RepID=UPI001C6EC525|nr:PadR family transcriptional regulator [Clostridium sp. CM027]MBW9144449.1 PadR family transcriptional regulator [Clostridium sp. CM027]UVE40775.1 PadR family transcriptional regulator [Clostridium sp. CM027]